jgi:signal transduction histidine kinase
MTSDSWRAFKASWEGSPPPPNARELDSLEAQARYETPRAVAEALDEIGVGLALIELGTEKVMFASASLAQMLGRQMRDVINWPFVDLIVEEDASVALHRLHTGAAPEGAPRTLRFRQGAVGRVAADVAFRPLGRKGRYGMVLMVATPAAAREEGRTLRVALDHALTSLRHREDLFAFAAHELRTPLTPLMLHLQALLRSVDHDSSVLRSLMNAEAQVKRLIVMVDQFLDVARARAGRLEIERREVDLYEIVRDVAERFALDSARTDTPIDVVASEPVIGRWDPLRLDQIATNLISNAVKYGAGSPVFVSVRSSDTHATLTVVDYGPGIPAKHLSRIFNRFERANEDPRVQGSGLGLWIVRELAEAHGGIADVISEPGRGATFIVKLPLGPPGALPRRPNR